MTLEDALCHHEKSASYFLSLWLNSGQQEVRANFGYHSSACQSEPRGFGKWMNDCLTLNVQKQKPVGRGMATVICTSTYETNILPTSSLEDFRLHNAGIFQTVSWNNWYKNSHRIDLILCPSIYSWLGFQTYRKELGATVSEKLVLVCVAVSTCVHMHVDGRLRRKAAFLFWTLPPSSRRHHRNLPAFLEAHGYLYVIGWFSDENLMYIPVTFFWKKKMKQASYSLEISTKKSPISFQDFRYI